MNAIRTIIIVGLISTAMPGHGDELAAEVYRDENIRIHAGMSGQSGSIIHFGDVLSLVVEASFDPDRVSVEEPDETFFFSAWPDGDQPVLANRRTRRSDEGLRTVFYFQILDCPGEQWTCAGTRDYLLPEFSLNYQIDETIQSLTFRPWPSILTVASAIPLDEEDQLFPFKKYFPTNAYPDPVSGTDRTREALGIAGAGMAFLLGGILMWPFRSKKSSPFAGNSKARWQELIQELEDDDAADEGRYFDRLRKCFVWYCTDELNVDPFDWLDSRDEASELQSLFIELLHSPAGSGPELRTRFADLIAH